MIPALILERFAAVPGELVEVCRPHGWPDLTREPAAGMKSIRDILVHVAGAEAFWIHHVVLGRPRLKSDPAAFGTLDAVLEPWASQRAETMRYLEQLSPDQNIARRPFPWDRTKTASVDEIIWHVITHEQYHRGQIFTRLGLLGRRDLPDRDLLR